MFGKVWVDVEEGSFWVCLSEEEGSDPSTVESVDVWLVTSSEEVDTVLPRAFS